MVSSMQWERPQTRSEGEAETNVACSPNIFEIFGPISPFSVIKYGQSGGLKLVKRSGL